MRLLSGNQVNLEADEAFCHEMLVVKCHREVILNLKSAPLSKVDHDRFKSFPLQTKESENSSMACLYSGLLLVFNCELQTIKTPPFNN